jgi:hypothetical protein
MLTYAEREMYLLSPTMSPSVVLVPVMGMTLSATSRFVDNLPSAFATLSSHHPIAVLDLSTVTCPTHPAMIRSLV